MKKNCAFTIVAKNYMGLAVILEKSIRRYYNDLDFYIIVADEIPEELRREIPENVLVGKEVLGIDENTWENMSFKYNITEFCTSIKPKSFLYMISGGYEKIIYLDPDIYFFASIGSIFSGLDDCCVMLTPHILTIPKLGDTDSPEKVWRECGIFNLGFCGVNNAAKTKTVLEWWHERLINQCYINTLQAQFTDQKMVDFFPAFLTKDELLISDNLGMNVAPWNFFEREILLENENLYVKARASKAEHKDRLIFVHYSGYDYIKLSEGIREQRNISHLKNYSDLDILFSEYSESLKKEQALLKYINLTYTYNTFKNGIKIIDYYRRLYAALIDKGEKLQDPFNPAESFYILLKKKGIIKAQRCDMSKVSKFDFPNFKKKLKIINKCSRLVYKIIGVNRYFLMVRLFRSYSAYETHIHLLYSKYDVNNIS